MSDPRLVLPTSPCAACREAYGATCCERKIGEGPRLPMTYSEALRLARRQGVSVDQAVEVLPVTPEERAALVRAMGDRVGSLIVDGFGLYLPQDNNACRYLGPYGCLYPDVKPYLCRLFPFARDMHGEWGLGSTVGATGFCFGQDVAGDDSSVAFKVFQETPEALERLYRQQTRDMRMHALHVRRLTHGR